MTTRQFKRTAVCLGVTGLWLALATPALATRTVHADLGARQQAFVEANVSGELVAMETCPTTAFGDLTQ